MGSRCRPGQCFTSAQRQPNINRPLPSQGGGKTRKISTKHRVWADQPCLRARRQARPPRFQLQPAPQSQPEEDVVLELEPEEEEEVVPLLEQDPLLQQLVGTEVDDGRNRLLLSLVEDQDIVLELACLAVAGGAAPAATEAKKEEKVEDKEESDKETGFSLRCGQRNQLVKDKDVVADVGEMMASLPCLAVASGGAAPAAAEAKKEEKVEDREESDKELGPFDEGSQLLVPQVKDKDITELIANGREQLTPLPCGVVSSDSLDSAGGCAPMAVSQSGGAAPAAAEAKKEEKVEDKEESDEDMGSGVSDDE